MIQFGKQWSLSLITATISIVVFLSMMPLLLPNPMRWSLQQSAALFPWSTTASSADISSFSNYHGAPWKAEIGRWLSACHSSSSPLNIVESIGNKHCKNDCSSKGICNKALGQCRCFHGHAGKECSERLNFPCNLPSIPHYPHGQRLVSICSAKCDTTRAMCFCGERTAYPNRPVHEDCGFQIVMPSKPGQFKTTNWSKPDYESIYTTDKSKPGWCNVDPNEWHASKANVKKECDCRYDGFAGRLCEIPTECSCINQCSGHGHCRGGFCQCEGGWYGIDCSIPTASSPVKEWPKWLSPSEITVLDGVTIAATVKKKRPLIYVYDLPPEFNSHLLEGRHDKFLCVKRVYNGQNKTSWTGWPYASQTALLESILASSYVTMNADEADYFYVPVLDACIIIRADHSPSHHTEKFMGKRTYLALDIYKKAYNHIVEQYPYWNRSSGKDHIWFFAWDEGACPAPKEIWNSMMLVHWGNTNSKYNYSTTAYWADTWDPIPADIRGNHPCFDPSKDIVLPAWKIPDPGSLRSKLWARSRKQRKILFYFNGNLGPAYENGRSEQMYSMNIRQRVAEQFASVPNKKGMIGKQHQEDVMICSARTPNYKKELANSIFCGVFPGDGWSGRMEDAILQGCIPVIIQDGIYLPYENVFEYGTFAIRILEDDIPNMVKILRNINESQIDSMLANVQSIRQRFLYRDAVMLEAKRQKDKFGFMEDWGTEFSKLKEDDVFSTFIQILHYKLHNDPWRRDTNSTRKDYGLPRTCLVESGH